MGTYVLSMSTYSLIFPSVPVREILSEHVLNDTSWTLPILKARDSWFNDYCAVFDTPSPGMEPGDSWFSDRCTVSEDPMSDCSFPKREFPYALRYIYSVQHFGDECNVFFANPTKTLCIPTPEGWGFTAYSITKIWLVNGWPLTDNHINQVNQNVVG